MSCRSRRKGTLALLLLLYGAAVQAVDTAQILIVDLYLNQQRFGETFVLRDDNGNFFLEETVLLQWEFARPWPAPVERHNTNYYGVHQLAGAAASLNERAMQLQVSVPAALLARRSITMSGSRQQAISGGFGAYMDYELNWLSEANSAQDTSYGLFRPVVFGGFGNLSANVMHLNYSGDDVVDNEFQQSGTTLLELTYTRDDPDNVRSLRIGDVFAIAGSQGRALRIGGIQLATNFATQPALITHPLPDFYGETTVPTALDIYVNGRLTRRQDVQPGSYVLENVPVVNGAGQIQVVARDALGRQQLFVQDFYSSTELLKPGLSDYSISFGALREDYGLESFQYGELAASGTWRYGLRKNLTIEGHGEYSDGQGMLGGAARYALNAGGTLSSAFGLSSGQSGSGASWQLGFRRQSAVLNYNLDVSGTTKDFDLIGDSAPHPKLQVLATAAKNFYDYGSLALSVVHQSYHDLTKRTIISANQSKTFRNFLSLSTYLSYVDAADSDLSFGIRFSMPFGDDNDIHGGFSSSDSTQRLDAEIRRSLPYGHGYGYRLAVGAMDSRYIDAGVAAQFEPGTYRLEVRDNEYSGSVWRAAASGSVAYLDGMTKFTRQIRDAFAVVNVGDFEGVRVYAENQEIGRTNENGQLFVPGLRPYLQNRLRISIEDLPLHARIGDVEARAAPYSRSGVVVNFDVDRSAGVLLRAVLPDGSPVPEGAIATVEPSQKMYPVGRNGQLFLHGIEPSSRIRLRWRRTECELDVPFPGETAAISRLGDVLCAVEPIQ